MKSSERGAMLILVAVAIAMLMALGAFAVDYGFFWMSRGQAQDAADAGALAGATALELDDQTWPAPAGGIVETSAKMTAGANAIGGTNGVAVVSYVCPPYLTAPGNTNCIRVDVYRDGSFGSGTLPTYFANVFGVSSQGTKATATAQVSAANGSGCMRPWFITDRYTDVNGNGVYDAGDIYSFPGYKVPDDLGTSVIFHPDGGTSSYGQLDVGAGGAEIKDAIDGCARDGSGSLLSFAINDVVLTKPGATAGPEDQGVTDLLTWDPDYNAVTNPNGVRLDPSGHTVIGGCASTGTCACPSTAAQCPYGGGMSPRIVQSAVCAPTEFDCNGDATGAGSITIVNIISYFITSVTGSGPNKEIHAIIIGSAGEQLPGGSIGPTAAFLTTMRLVQ